MLTTPEIQNLLDKVSYKPDWEFSVYDGKHEGQHIVIRTPVQDAYDLDKIVVLDVHSMLPPCETAEQFYNWLLWRLKRLEVHECREFFRVDNMVYDDPHGPDADHDK